MTVYGIQSTPFSSWFTSILDRHTFFHCLLVPPPFNMTFHLVRFLVYIAICQSTKQLISSNERERETQISSELLQSTQLILHKVHSLSLLAGNKKWFQLAKTELMECLQLRKLFAPDVRLQYIHSTRHLVTAKRTPHLR